MNIVLVIFFFLSGFFVLFRRTVLSLMELFVSSDQVIRFFAIGYIVIFLPIALWLISLPDSTEILWKLVLLVVSIVAALEGLIFLVFPDLPKKIVNFYLSINFYLWAIPSSLICFLLALFLLARSYIGPIPEITECEPDYPLSVVCVVNNPEDLAVTPDNNFLIVSEFGGIEPLEEMIPGKLSLLDLITEESLPLDISYSTNTWGDGLCIRKSGDLIGPHGIDLVQRDEDLYQLAVVNHIEYESVEMYELLRKGSQWALNWRGCVKAPIKSYLNDVSLKSDGSFFVSHMYDREVSITTFLAGALFKYDTGYVLQWNNKEGFSKVVGSEGAMPNGIAFDQSKNLLYINDNLGDKVRVLDLTQNKEISRTFLNSPDNLILKNNSLWVTTLDHEILDTLRCSGMKVCTLPFSIYELNPISLEEKNRFSFKKTIFGLPTVALPIGNKIWIGSFRSDRVAYLNTERK